MPARGVEPREQRRGGRRRRRRSTGSSDEEGAKVRQDCKDMVCDRRCADRLESRSDSGGHRQIARTDSCGRGGSVDMPRSGWRVEPQRAGDDPGLERYSAPIEIPMGMSGKYRDIRVFIQPRQGYQLVSVEPRSRGNRAVPSGQEPAEVGSFRSLRSEWLFPEFDSSLEWRLVVDVRQSVQSKVRRGTVPLSATLYFH